MLKRVALINDHATSQQQSHGARDNASSNRIARLAYHLANQGYAIDILQRRTHKDLPDMEPLDSAIRTIQLHVGPVLPMPRPELLAFLDEFITQTVKLVQREGAYDLVHANSWLSGIVAAHLQDRFKIPFVVTMQTLARALPGHDKTESFLCQRAKIEDWLVEQATGIVVSEPNDIQNLVLLYGANPEKICLLPEDLHIRESWSRTIPVHRPRHAAKKQSVPVKRRIKEVGIYPSHL